MNILARLGLDTAGFKAGLASSRSALSGFAGVISGLFSGAAIKGVLDYGEHIQKLSERFNVSTGALQRFGNAAELNGSSLESMAKGFNKLEISQSRALGGSEKIQAAFASLGISIDDLRSLSPEEIMAKVGKSSMNAADMVAVFGKSALELRPTLAGLADGTIAYGDAISAIDIKKLAEADEAWKRLWQTIRIFSGSALGTIKSEIDYLADGIRNLGETGTHSFKGLAAAVKGDFKEAIKEGQLATAGLKYAWDDMRTGGAGYEAKKKAQEDREKASADKRKFTPADKTDEEKASTVKKREAAEQKERERLQFSLNEIADRKATFGNDQTIQAWWAGQQARQVQDLQALALEQSVNDGGGIGSQSRATLDRADALRQSIGGLSESEKQVGAFKTALAVVEQNTATTNEILQQDE